MLWELAGPKLFRRLFAVVLPDNGPEFSDPKIIEKYRPDPVHNSTKLVPRGIKVFFCDPYCSSQKPHVERVHIELRRIPANEVTLHPFLLGERFQRIADKAVLRKNGIQEARN